MSTPQPFVRDAGAGPSVICLHCNASTSGQWLGLSDLLSESHRVLAPDLFDSGKSPKWCSDREMRLQDEVDLVAPALAAIEGSFSLVGHSYGAAVALIAALRHLGRVTAMALYEPTLFSLVDAHSPPPNGADGIRNTAAAAAAALDAGDQDAAACHFIDFWMGSGSWAAMPPQRKPAVASAVGNVRRWEYALFNEPTPAESFASLDMPVLYMLGERSPESAHAVAEELIPVLSQVKVVRFPDLGHMAPVTHPEVVNAEITRFLGEV